MTDNDLLRYYAGLLILQYKGLIKADATIQALVRTVIEGQLPLQIQEAFDLETAQGVQLDIIGKYAGVTRDGYTFTAPVTLTDDEFRILIKLKIVKNNSGSSLADIQNLMGQYFLGDIKVYDYKDMSMSYYVNSSLGSQDLVEVFITKGLLPAPMAVGLGTTVYHPTGKFFSFRTYEYPSTGFPFNTYDSYNEAWPWLLYDYGVNVPVTIERRLLTENGLNTIVQENGDYILV